LLAEFPKSVKDFGCEVRREGTSTRWHEVKGEVLAKLYHSCRGAIFAFGTYDDENGFICLIFLGDFFVMKYVTQIVAVVGLK